MLCSGVAACHRYGVCTFHCVECTQHSEMYTESDMLPHHRKNDVVFIES